CQPLYLSLIAGFVHVTCHVRVIRLVELVLYCFDSLLGCGDLARCALCIADPRFRQHLPPVLFRLQVFNGLAYRLTHLIFTDEAMLVFMILRVTPERLLNSAALALADIRCHNHSPPTFRTPDTQTEQVGATHAAAGVAPPLFLGKD